MAVRPENKEIYMVWDEGAHSAGKILSCGGRSLML